MNVAIVGHFIVVIVNSLWKDCVIRMSVEVGCIPMYLHSDSMVIVDVGDLHYVKNYVDWIYPVVVVMITLFLRCICC